MSTDTEQISLLREAASRFVKSSSPELLATNLFAQVTEMGWNRLLVPEEYGGYDGSFADMAAVVEELGRGPVAGPVILPAVLVSRVLQHCCKGLESAGKLKALLGAEVLPAFAWSGLATEKANASIKLSRNDKGEQVLSGTVPLCAESPDYEAILIGDDAELPNLFLIDRKQPGITIERRTGIDLVNYERAVFTGVRVGAENSLASGMQVAAGLERARYEVTIAACAELLGISLATFDLTIEHVTTRIQFGKPLGTFQALQHRLVDQYIQLRLAAASLAQAVELLDRFRLSVGRLSDADERSIALAACRTKARCADMALKVTRESIQLHGAMGFTEEYKLNALVKRAITAAAWLGNASVQRRAYASVAYS